MAVVQTHPRIRLKILYLGNNYGTSRHRAEALRRLGHQVEIVDVWDFFSGRRAVRSIIAKVIYEIGANGFEFYILQRLRSAFAKQPISNYDVVWTDQCEFIGAKAAQWLRSIASTLISYAVDDPFGYSGRRRFSLYRQGVPFYDLLVVVRETNIAEAYAHGARKVLRVFRSADEVAHKPLEMTSEEIERWKSDVAFIGTWMPERGPFMARLIEYGVPLAIWGDRWHKAKEWPLIQRAWRSPALWGQDYVRAIQCARICLGLLSKGNRDLHTQRSLEIPYIGSLFCAERTDEHCLMYQEGVEAVFWESPEECAEKCFTLLSDETRRRAIAQAGHARCLRNGFLNEPVMQQILDAALGKDVRANTLPSNHNGCSIL